MHLLDHLVASGRTAFDALRARGRRRRRSDQALRRSEEGLNEAQRIARVGSWDLDLVRDTLSWSPEIYRIFEIDPQRFGASYEAFLEAVHPEDRRLVDEAYSRSVRERTPYEIVHRLLMRDGRTKFVQERCETSYDPAGRPLRSIGTVQDITERRKAELEVARLNAELEERVAARTAALEAANRDLQAFAYTVSHDLRAPVRHLVGFAELLREDCGEGLGEQGRSHLSRIEKSARSMAALIDDLLSFSMLGAAEIRSEPVDLGRLVAEVVEAHRGETASRDVAWRIGELPTISGDAHLLRVALDNLVSNALKFTRTRPRAEIEIGCTLAPSSAALFVRDNGVGFDGSDAGKLFQVFQRLHGKDAFDGTGIGLATVRRIVERHGGRVRAEGTVDGGATFHLSLPLHESARGDGSPGPQASVPQGS